VFDHISASQVRNSK